ncbi:hypothetical protein KUTeg_011702 [Tegillarca granosa]|uniref:TIR domain-containing protein n=1 Tax=Tegillarca granosa TaxID=220873 RepID=A0ABQ9F1T4_TEGGR|nr:hypothetical protein KUTeg_011702 [Tegillarca granosa]
MKHTHLNWKFITVFFALSLYFSRTCNGLLHDLNDECSNCTMVLYKTRGTFADCSSRGFIRVPYCKVANIKQLFLSSNRIVTIHENAFQSMKTLEVIALDGNKIQYIHEKAFYNLLHLRELHIEYNELNQQSFSKNLFYPLINLRVLHICGNPFEYDKIHTLENAVSALNSLRSLHIPGFEGFDFEHTFRNLNRLTDLQMCDGYITYTNKTFSGFVNNTIEYISLDVSGYDTIVNVLESLSPFQNKSMEYLRIGDNSGGFNFRPIVTVTSKNFKYLANICTSEINLRYDRILHITQAALASLKHINCIKKIDLSGNLLTSAIIPGITLFRNLEYLNMCCLLRKRVKRTLQDITNKLRTKHNIRPHLQVINMSYTIGYDVPNITFYNASHANLNQGLQKIPDGSLFRGLTNKSDMQVISTLISRGTRIKLEGNKFICTCDTGDFIRWLFSLKNRIDFERNKCVMNNGISVLTGVLLLSVIVYRYRIEIEYFLYKLQWWLFPRQPSNDYDYDVIILFSHLDTPFAKNVLLTYLENELKLKTYFYPRDSLPGENIADSICENIQKSRKVIFVLTENYLKSRWIGFEFDQARMYMYKMYSEHNIIIITKGDISIKKCPDIIKNLYSRILFLQYPKEDSDEERNAFHRKLKEKNSSKLTDKFRKVQVIELPTSIKFLQCGTRLGLRGQSKKL